MQDQCRRPLPSGQRYANTRLYVIVVVQIDYVFDGRLTSAVYRTTFTVYTNLTGKCYVLETSISHS